MKVCNRAMRETRALRSKALGSISDLPAQRLGHDRASCLSNHIRRLRKQSLLMKVFVLPIHWWFASINQSRKQEAGGGRQDAGGIRCQTQQQRAIAIYLRRRHG